MSNAEMLFASGLNLLDELDRSLPHGADDIWPEDVSLRRNILVWQVAFDAINAGLTAGVSEEENWPVVYIELPTGQVSWHVPTCERPPGCEVPTKPGYEWDGHTREEKARRISEYLSGVHFEKIN